MCVQRSKSSVRCSCTTRDCQHVHHTNTLGNTPGNIYEGLAADHLIYERLGGNCKVILLSSKALTISLELVFKLEDLFTMYCYIPHDSARR